MFDTMVVYSVYVSTKALDCNQYDLGVKGDGQLQP